MLNTKNALSNYAERPLLDKRRSKVKNMSLDNVFYVVHLVSQGEETWHRASLIAADTDDVFFEGLCQGISEIQTDVAKEMAYTGEINSTNPDSLLVHPIFIRNLNADHRDVVEALEVTKISQELSTLISTKPDLLRYIVIGLVVSTSDSGSPFMAEVKAENAMIAIDRVTTEVQTQMGSNFRPLFATIKAPVTSELFGQYNKGAAHIRDFVSAVPSFGQMLH